MENAEARIEMDASFENYTPPESVSKDTVSKEQSFVNDVKKLAENYGLDFIVATRNGVFYCEPGDSEVLKAVASCILEENGKPENVRLNN